MQVKLHEFIEGVHGNAMRSLNSHSRYAHYLQQISDTFGRALDLPEIANLGPRLFVAMSHADCLGAIHLASSGQLPPAYMAARGSLESAIYGFYVTIKPELKVIWSSRHVGEDEKKAVRDAFKIGDMKRALRAVNNNIEQQFATAYDATIDLGAHPNSLAFLTNLTEKPDGSTEWLYVNTESLPMRMALSTAAFSGVTALLVLSEAFKKPFLKHGITRTALELTSRLSELDPLPNSAA